jgi:hypothetical protein
MMRAWWLVLALTVSGCSLFPSLSSFCPSHALGIKVTFTGEAQRTDELAFRVWIDNDPTQAVSMGYKRTPGGDDATLEVDFKDYDAHKFHTVHVVAIAREKGKRIGSYSTQDTIGADCTSSDILLGLSSSSYGWCASNADCDSGVCPQHDDPDNHIVAGCCGSGSSSSSYCF